MIHKVPFLFCERISEGVCVSESVFVCVCVSECVYVCVSVYVSEFVCMCVSKRVCIHVWCVLSL